jgi:antirestriction protein
MEPQIFVQHLAAYNNGLLIGEWLDATQDLSDLETEVKEILSRYPGEEWIIGDYSDFGAIKLSKTESLENIARFAEGIAKYGEAFTVWYQLHNEGEWSDNQFSITGEYSSMDEYVEKYLRDNLPKQIADFRLCGMSVKQLVDREKLKGYFESALDYEVWEGTIYVFN